MNLINKDRYDEELFSEIFEFVKSVNYNEFKEINKSSHDYHGYLNRIEVEINIDLLKTEEKVGIYLNNLLRFMKNTHNIQIETNIIKNKNYYKSLRSVSLQLPQSSCPDLEYDNIVVLDLETLDLLIEDSDKGRNLLFANTLHINVNDEYYKIIDCLWFDLYKLKLKKK